MSVLGNQLQCTSHPQREAAARCTGCQGFFCRECITEHDLRMFCATCLREALNKPAASKHRFFLWSHLLTLTQFAGGLIILWLSFYLIGRLLIAIPSDFHDGTPPESRTETPP